MVIIIEKCPRRNRKSKRARPNYQKSFEIKKGKSLYAIRYFSARTIRMFLYILLRIHSIYRIFLMRIHSKYRMYTHPGIVFMRISSDKKKMRIAYRDLPFLISKLFW